MEAAAFALERLVDLVERSTARAGAPLMPYVMPELSRFFGIVIYMYHRDHVPAHFHAEYAEYEITVDVETGAVTGDFPRRALRLVLEWYSLHRNELAADWELAQSRQPLKPIDPLE